MHNMCSSEQVKAYKEYNVSGFPELPPNVFDRHHHGLFPEWKMAVDSFVERIEPLVHNGTVAGNLPKC